MIILPSPSCSFHNASGHLHVKSSNAVYKTIPVHFHSIEQCLDEKADSANLSPVDIKKD